MPYPWQTQSQNNQKIITVSTAETPSHHQQRQHIDAKSSLLAILASNSCTSNPSISNPTTSDPTTSTSTSTTTTTPNSPPTSTSASTSQKPILVPKQLENLNLQINVLSKEATQTERLVLQTTGKLKEFGDLQTWAEVVWREIYVLEEVLGGGGEGGVEGR